MEASIRRPDAENVMIHRLLLPSDHEDEALQAASAEMSNMSIMVVRKEISLLANRSKLHASALPTHLNQVKAIQDVHHLRYLLSLYSLVETLFKDSHHPNIISLLRDASSASTSFNAMYDSRCFYMNTGIVHSIPEDTIHSVLRDIHLQVDASQARIYDSRFGLTQT